MTEPHVRRYYHWHMQYGDDEEKGDYSIDARGSSALVERDLQNQAVMQMGSIVTNPVFGKDPKKWMDEFLKSQHLDVQRFDYDDEQWQKIVEQLAKAPSDPRVEVAKMTIAHKEKLQSAEQQFEQGLKQLEQQFAAREGQMERELKLLIEGMKQQGQQQVSVDALKGLLASTSMKLVVQERMSDKSNRIGLAKEVMKPPAEPKGRAKPGKSFEQ